MTFQVYQSVKVENEELELHGHAGNVVEPSRADGQIGVRMDVDGVVWEFAPSDLRAL